MSHILCQTRRAETPWYIENAGLHIYSLEELCYFICDNLALLDEGILTEGLFRWLGRELGLSWLSHRLLQLQQKERTVAELILPILQETNYLSSGELRRLEQELNRMAGQPASLRRKQRGDALLLCKKYTRAIEAYRDALEEAGKVETSAAIYGGIYHNAGCAYSRLFQLDEAVECFRLAYETLHSGKSLRNYLCAVYMKEGPTAFELLCHSLSVDEATEKEILAEMQGMEVPAMPEDPDAAIKAWTREYHRSTDM